MLEPLSHRESETQVNSMEIFVTLELTFAMSAARKLRFIRAFGLFATGGLCTAYAIKTYRNFGTIKEKMKLHIDNKPVALPESLKNLLHEIRNDMGVENNENLKYNFFVTKGINLIHSGEPSLANGADIGIPYYFLFDRASDIDVAVMMNEGFSVTDSALLNSLKQSMSLSKEAKKFGLVQEMFRSQHSFIIPWVLLPTVTAFNFTFLSYIVQKSLNKQKKPVTVLHNVFLVLFGICFFMVFYDMHSVSKEYNSDYMASQLGSSYIRGGLEFYEKMMERNKILKKVQKNAPFTESGDIHMPFFRNDCMLLKKRLVYLKEFQENKEKNFLKYVLL